MEIGKSHSLLSASKDSGIWWYNLVWIWRSENYGANAVNLSLKAAEGEVNCPIQAVRQEDGCKVLPPLLPVLSRPSTDWMHPCVFMLLWHSLEWEWKFLSCVQLFGTPWTMEFQSMEFSRPEHWSRQSLPGPGHFPKPGVETRSPASQADSSPAEIPAKPSMLKRMIYWAHWFKSSSHQETPSEALPKVIFNPGTPWAIQVDTKLAIAPRLFLFFFNFYSINVFETESKSFTCQGWTLTTFDCFLLSVIGWGYLPVWLEAHGSRPAGKTDPEGRSRWDLPLLDQFRRARFFRSSWTFGM